MLRMVFLSILVFISILSLVGIVFSINYFLLHLNLELSIEISIFSYFIIAGILGMYSDYKENGFKKFFVYFLGLMFFLIALSHFVLNDNYLVVAAGMGVSFSIQYIQYFLKINEDTSKLVFL